MEKLVKNGEVMLRHKLASGLLGSFAGITVHHYVEKLYDIVLDAYRAKQSSKNE